MCRLYGFRATEPTKVECSLVHAQNALVVQSREDRQGQSHSNGWGVATYTTRGLHVERQAWAAYHGEHFRQAAARTYSQLVVAHVRRATVGPATLENTHPFSHQEWAFAQNGTLRAFDKMREQMCEAMIPEYRAAIRGQTDSEHLFRFLLSRREENTDLPLLTVLRQGLVQILDLSRTADANAKIGLNVLWTNGSQLVGSRWGRPLWHVERDRIYDCEICGFPHVRHDPHEHYQAVVIASEPISAEAWQAIPEGSIFSVDADARLRVEPLC